MTNPTFGNRLIRWLSRYPCRCDRTFRGKLPFGCTYTCFERDGGRSGLLCRRHALVYELLFGVVGVFQTTEGGDYRDGWIEPWPGRWVGKITLKLWPRHCIKVLRSRGINCGSFTWDKAR